MQTVEIDGSAGEGGGQILRTALSLSLLTQTPFRIVRIRANRKPPGLRPQHLACVRGAEAISESRSEGARVDSDVLEFWPGAVKPGDYLLDIGSAGSTPLLLQCLFFPLSLRGGGTLTLRGGTHVPHSPTYQYLSWIWAPTMAAYGLHVDLKMTHAGFYPKGGGEIVATIGAVGEPPSLVSLPSRGALRDAHVTSWVGGLPFPIAERQAKAAVQLLREKGVYCEAEKLPMPTTRSVGSTVFVRAQFENTAAGFSAIGERGRPAEEVGRDAASQLAEFLETAGAIDEHLGDQLLLPAALLAAGLLGPAGHTRYTAARHSGHLTTNAQILEKFLPIQIGLGSEGEVTVGPRG